MYSIHQPVSTMEENAVPELFFNSLKNESLIGSDHATNLRSE